MTLADVALIARPACRGRVQFLGCEQFIGDMVRRWKARIGTSPARWAGCRTFMPAPRGTTAR